jgi:phospholipid/cholesterol/gamma-HCH transport system permease protein
LPLLAALFSAIGVIGGHLAGVELLNVDAGAYWSQMQSSIDFYDDIINGIIKSIIFAWLVSWVALFEGYDALPTSAGISRATTRTVVNSAFAILLFDFLLTALMFGAN